MKRCTKCGEEKPLSEFSICRSKKSGYQSHCKLCRSEDNKKWYYENLETARARSRKNAIKSYYKNVKKHQEAARKYYAAHAEEKREYSRVYSRTHREKCAAYDREYMAKHPWKRRERKLRRRALKLGNGGVITSAEWKWLKEFYNFTCVRCGRREPEIKLTLDHVMPLTLGGQNTIQNAQPLCWSCNSSKQAKHIDYRKAPTFLQQVAFA